MPAGALSRLVRIRSIRLVLVTLMMSVGLVAVATPAHAVGGFTIDDVTKNEGDSGTTTFTFTVTLALPRLSPTTVAWDTFDDTATAGVDYTAGTGLLTFLAGETSKTVDVLVTGDTHGEPNEKFSVVLRDATEGVDIDDDTGVGEIFNDDAGVPTIETSSETFAEDVGDGDFTVTLTNPPTQTVTVDYATSNGTATAGSDYTAKMGTLTFGVGETSKTVSVPITDDTADEMDTETFTLTLSNPDNASMLVDPIEVTGTIQDNDDPPVVSIADTTNAESGDLTFTVTLDAASGKTITVPYATSDGTATAGSDYAADSGTVTFSAGDTSETIVVDVTQDTIDEVDETVVVTLSTPTNATLGTSSAIGTITDDDGEPNLSIDDVDFTEGDSGTTTGNFTVTLDAASAKTITVDFATTAGTATATTDYLDTSGSLIFNPGQTSKSIPVEIVGDTADEDNETFDITLSSAVNAGVTDGAGVGTITDDDAAPSLSIDDVEITEGNTGSSTMTFTITQSATAGRDITVDVTTVDDTATGGSDYVAVASTATIAEGDTSTTVAVTVFGDSINEADETFDVVLSNPSDGVTLTDDTGVGTINNDDEAAGISIVDATPTDEGDTGTTSHSFTVKLSKAVGQTITVEWATASATATSGTDFTAASGTVTFVPGDTSETVSVSVTGDTNAEPDETFSVVLSDPDGATITDDTGIGTIQNDDGAPPTLTISDRSVTEGDTGTVNAGFTITLSAESFEEVRVDFTTVSGTATAGEDFTAVSGTRVFSAKTIATAGETQEFVTVVVLADDIYEGTEDFTVVLSNARNAVIADDTGDGEILDDDDPPTIGIDDPSVTEGDAGSVDLDFTVTLSAASNFETAVDWSTAEGTATGDTDYTTASGTLTIPAGETSGTITVSVSGDVLDEDDETLTVTLTNPSGGTIGDDTGTGTILDDDATPTLSIDDQTTAEGDSGQVSEMFTITLSAVSGRNVTVDFTTADGSATAGADYTATSGTAVIPAGDTTVEVTVLIEGDTLDEDDESYTVVLSSPTNATLADDTGLGTITDDDDAPTLSIDDQTTAEGDSGSTTETFTITLSAVSGRDVTVDFATADGTATAGEDYTAVAGTATIVAGDTTATVDVDVTGDTADEPDETYTVELSAPTGATIADGTGDGTITDDDDTPALSIDDVSVAEGDAGSVTATLTVTLDGLSGSDVTFDWATSDESATAGSDYVAGAASGTITAGATTTTIDVAVTGDTAIEADETFTVDLTNPSGATIADGSGTVTILDDESPGQFHPIDPDGEITRALVRRGQQRRQQVLGRGGIPAEGVAAVVVHAIVLNPDRAGGIAISADPAADDPPVVLAFDAREATTSLLTLVPDAEGRLWIDSDATAELRLRSVGWYDSEPTTDGLVYEKTSVERPLSFVSRSGEIKKVKIAGRAGVAEHANAVAVMVTVRAPEGTGFGSITPTAATRRRTVIWNGREEAGAMAIIPLADDGTITYRHVGKVANVDMYTLGYFHDRTVDPTGAMFVPVDYEVLGAGVLEPDDVKNLTGRGDHGIPDDPSVKALILNQLVVDADGDGLMSLAPTTKIRNLIPYNHAEPVASSHIMPLADSGAFRLRNKFGTNFLVSQIAGFFIEATEDL